MSAAGRDRTGPRPRRRPRGRWPPPRRDPRHAGNPEGTRVRSRVCAPSNPVLRPPAGRTRVSIRARAEGRRARAPRARRAAATCRGSTPSRASPPRMGAPRGAAVAYGDSTIVSRKTFKSLASRRRNGRSAADFGFRGPAGDYFTLLTRLNTRVSPGIAATSSSAELGDAVVHATQPPPRRGSPRLFRLVAACAPFAARIEFALPRLLCLLLCCVLQPRCARKATMSATCLLRVTTCVSPCRRHVDINAASNSTLALRRTRYAGATHPAS